MVKKLKKLGLVNEDYKDYEEDYEFLDEDGKAYKTLKQKDISLYFDFDFVFFGKKLKLIKDDETGKEFKDKTQKILNEIFKEDIKCEIIEHIIDGG
jgi:hypothetical protein